MEIPKEVRGVMGVLAEAGHQAYLVGGCVRDMRLKRDPKDWDVATDATPEEIQKLFPESVYENTFGTVGIKTDSEDPKLKIIEVTTFRIESAYTDKRHPDQVKFAKTIEEDLARRDFTVNAMAMTVDGDIVDPFDGEKDLKAKLIRTVGKPEDRFNEDALRLMRAVRFATELDFEIEPATRKAIEKLSKSLGEIAQERVRDELVKIMMTPRAASGIIMLEELGLLANVIPELREGIGMTQNKHHVFTVFEHNVKSLDHVAKDPETSLIVRLGTLLHDVGKPRVKGGDGPDSTFYNHDIIGGKMTKKILERLHFSTEMGDQVAHLVRYHMFYYNVGDVSDAGVRRFVRRVGPEYIADLLKVREGDRIGSGVPKAVPYKLRHLLFMIEKVKNDPLSPKMLALKGDDLMKLLGIEPGPRVGQILNILLEDVLDDPTKNTMEYLSDRAKELHAQTDKQLAELSKQARDKKDEVQGDIEEDMKKKYHVT
jgi:tRNA nucleotidyltransferase (CCA-adding enzyme)